MKPRRSRRPVRQFYGRLGFAAWFVILLCVAIFVGHMARVADVHWKAARVEENMHTVLDPTQYRLISAHLIRKTAIECAERYGVITRPEWVDVRINAPRGIPGKNVAVRVELRMKIEAESYGYSTQRVLDHAVTLSLPTEAFLRSRGPLQTFSETAAPPPPVPTPVRALLKQAEKLRDTAHSASP